jgi:deoxyribonuclease IV
LGSLSKENFHKAGEKEMKFGCHVSIQGGYLAAAKQAKALGARGFQYFPKNPRTLAVKSFHQHDAEACAQFCRDYGMVSISHSPYLTNLSADEPDLRKAMMASIYNDLEITEACGSIGLVVHFGKYKGKDPLEGYKLMIDMLNEVLNKWSGKTLLLLENNAGQGGKMGTTFEELVQIRKLTDVAEKIGFCFDTCHAFASGLWQGENWQDVEQKGEELGYFPHLRVIHLNDSAYPCQSFRDRHANIGKGFIGMMGFKELFRSQLGERIPMILETPSSSTYTHRDELQYLNEYAQSL